MSYKLLFFAQYQGKMAYSIKNNNLTHKICLFSMMAEMIIVALNIVPHKNIFDKLIIELVTMLLELKCVR